MATRIPTYQRSIGIPDQLPAARATSVEDSQDPIAAAASNIAKGAMQLGGEMLQKQQREAENVGAVQVSNILSDGQVYWQENADTRFKGFKVGDPDLREGIKKDFTTWQDENEAKLPTPSSRDFFRKHSNSMLVGLQENAYKYTQRATTDKLNAETAVGEQADENIVFNDKSQLDSVYARRMETVVGRTDLDEGQKIAAADKYRRKLYFSAERGELERDPTGWYKARFGDFAVGTMGSSIVGTSVSNTPVGPVRDSLWRAQIGQESGGRQFGDDGKPLTSSKGAVGVAQVMRDTGPIAAKLAGIPWDERRYYEDAGYNEALGKAYMAQQLRTFGGDEKKALAAYNMGPGSAEKGNGVAGLIKTYGDDWLSHAPQETQDYVKRITARAPAQAPSKAAGVDTVDQSTVQPPSPISQPKTFTGMDWEQQSALKQAAEVKIKQGEAQFKSTTDKLVADASAMHRDGIVDDFNLNRGTFDRAYGGDGARVYQEYQNSREMATHISKYKTESVQDIASDLEASKPRPGAGYAADVERYGTRMRAAQQVVTARTNDPAGYATQNNASLKQQSNSINQLDVNSPERPAMLQQYVRNNINEQIRLGIQVPKILTPEQSDRIARQAMSAAKPEDSANLIAGLEKDYGSEFFPQVFSQLVKEDKLSQELLIIPNLPTQTAREAVSRMSRIKESDLTNGIDHNDQKIVKDAVTVQMEKFAKAVPLLTTQSATMIDSYATLIRKQAYAGIAAGQKPADAVDFAYKMVLGHYEFDDTARYPKGLDVGIVQAGKNLVMKSKLDDIDVPRDITGARLPDEAKKEWLNTVQARPLWYTSDDDKGLELWANGNNGTRYRVTRSGQPVKYTFDQLKAFVATDDATRIQTRDQSLQPVLPNAIEDIKSFLGFGATKR